MIKYGFLLSLLFVGGLAYPAPQDDGPHFDEDMAIFFDHTIKDVEGRIVGGSVAPVGAYPWMVSLTSGIAVRSFLCGGSIVTVRRILSAAHCIDFVVSGGTLSSSLLATVGTNVWNSGGQTYTLNGFVNHERYNPMTVKNDIGILFVSSNIILSGLVAIIPINYNHIFGNQASRVSGWGMTSTVETISMNLLELETTTVDGQRCVMDVAAVGQQLNIPVPAVDPTIELCTFTMVDQGVCSGDSGSALVLNSNNQQIGIVSWGVPCARGAPDMFVRLSAYRDWITPHLA